MSKSNCILIVDDSEDTRELFTATLEAEHFEVVSCEDGEQALKILRQRDDFALMLLDLSMPNMSGMEMLEEMRRLKLGVGIPVMLVSAFRDFGPIEVPYNVIGTLKKPFFFPELIFKIRKIVGPGPETVTHSSL
jgi:DNA-binding response OmpR family regulator